MQHKSEPCASQQGDATLDLILSVIAEGDSRFCSGSAVVTADWIALHTGLPPETVQHYLSALTDLGAIDERQLQYRVIGFSLTAQGWELLYGL